MPAVAAALVLPPATVSLGPVGLATREPLCRRSVTRGVSCGPPAGTAGPAAIRVVLRHPGPGGCA
eukprot:10505161-Heterocapsa_arctica.AAC.1